MTLKLAVSIQLSGVLAIIILFVATDCLNAQNSSLMPGGSPGSPSGSIIPSESESINLFNGNLSFSVPLAGASGRGNTQLSLSLDITQSWSIDNYYRLTDYDGDGLYEPEYFYFPIPYNRDDVNFFNNLGYSFGPGKIKMEPNAVSGNPHSSNSTYTTHLVFASSNGTVYKLFDEYRSGLPACRTQDSFYYPLHQDNNRGKIFVTKDGTAARFISDSDIFDNCQPDTSYDGVNLHGYLLLRDGTRYRIDNSKISWMRDRNGNTLRFTYGSWNAPDYNRLIKTTDSLNREVIFEYGVNDPGVAPDGTPYGHCDRITYKGFEGSSHTIRISKKSLSQELLRNDYSLQTYRQLFPDQWLESSDTYFDPEKYSAVWLPNGRAYKFQYNGYGQLARVQLPTGGAIEYDWDVGVVNSGVGGVVIGSSTGIVQHSVVYHRVVQKRVYLDGQNLATRTSYSRPQSIEGFTRNNLGYVDIDHLSNSDNPILLARERHHFYGVATNSFNQDVILPWREGKEHRTEWLNNDGVTPVRSVVMNWEQTSVGWWMPNASGCYQTSQYTLCQEPQNNPLITEAVTTLDNGLVAKQRYGYDNYSNQTDVWQYEFGQGQPGGLVNHSHTDYKRDGYDSHDGPYLLNLPTTSWVKDGQSRTLSQSEVRYDETSLLNRGAVTGWVDPGTTARGNATSAAAWLDTTNTWLTTRVEYDTLGNLVKTTDAKNKSATIGYDDAFAVGAPSQPTYAFPTSTASVVPDPTGANGSTTPLTASTRYDYWTGLPTSATDANGVVTAIEYNDALNRPTRVIHAQGTTAQSQSTTVYDDINHTVTATSDLNSFNDNTLKSQSIYDGMGRTVESRQYESANGYIATRQKYNSLGRAYRASNPFRPANGEQPVWTTSSFDALGRVTQVETPDGAKVSSSYLGNTVTVTDQAGKSRKSETDALGRLVKVWEDPQGVNYQTSYDYDALGNLRRVVQGSQQRFFMYDSLSRLIRAKNLEQAANGNLSLSDSITGNSQWSLGYSYDANGNLSTRVDARNITTSYAYDNLNRNVTTSYANDGGLTPNVRRFYEGVAFGRGRMRTSNTYSPDGVSTPDGVYTRNDAFDELGRIAERWVMWKTSTTRMNYYRFGYTYNLAGGVKRLTNLTTNQYVEYDYDQAGRVKSVTGTLANEFGDATVRVLTDEIEYSALGGMTKERFGTQTQLYHKRQYNVRGQLWDIRLATGADANGSWDRGAVQLYYDSARTLGGSGADNNGNVTATMHYIPDASGSAPAEVYIQSYGYDGLNRVQTARETNMWGAQTWTQGFGYDRWGNRSITGAAGGVNNKAFAVDPATNRLGVPGGQQGAINYDAAGNQTTDTYTGNGNREYDAEGRLVRVSDVQGNLIARYEYTAEGERMRRWTATGEWWSAYDVGGEMLLDGLRTAAGGDAFVYRNGELIVKREYDVQTNSYRRKWMVADQLGTPRMIADESGSLAGISRHDYLPFGEEVGAGIGGRTTGQGYSGNDGVRQKFTGYERDVETGLDFAQARYFSSVQGRFTSVDPLMSSGTVYDPQTWNRYSYAINNPLKWTDPDGLYIWNDSLGGDVTDDELRRRARDNRNALRDANRIIERRNEFRNTLTAAGRARDALPAGAERDLVSASLASYGAEGVANGVSVSQARLADGVAAEARTGAFSYNEATGAITANVEVVLSDRRGGNLSVDVAHEGRHVADAQEFGAALTADTATGGANAVAGATNRTRYEREVRGYTVSSLVAQGLGLDNLSVGRREIWNRGWSQADRAAATSRTRAIDNHLRESPTYRLTPQNPGERYMRRQ